MVGGSFQIMDVKVQIWTTCEDLDVIVVLAADIVDCSFQEWVFEDLSLM